MSECVYNFFFFLLNNLKKEIQCYKSTQKPSEVI